MNHLYSLVPISLAVDTSHQCLVSINECRVPRVDKLDGLDQLLACVNVELLGWLAEDGRKNGEELGCEAKNDWVLVLV